MRWKLLPALPLLSLVQACGGAGSDAVGELSPVPSATIRLAAFDALASRLEDLPATAALPVSGSATYKGYIGATADVAGAAPVFLTADTQLTANFGAETMSGSFGNLIASGGVPVSGSGTISNGTIGIAGIDAEVGGNLVIGGTGYALSGTLDGAFLGPGAEGLTAVVDGTLRQGGAPVGLLNGELWAER